MGDGSDRGAGSEEPDMGTFHGRWNKATEVDLRGNTTSKLTTPKQFSQDRK